MDKIYFWEDFSYKIESCLHLLLYLQPSLSILPNPLI